MKMLVTFLAFSMIEQMMMMMMMMMMMEIYTLYFCTLYPPAYYSFISFLMSTRILLSRKTIKVHRTRGALETSWNPLETSAAIFQKPKNQNTNHF
jgi:hypothetical protein